MNIELDDNKLKFFDELSKLNNTTIEESISKFIGDKLNSIVHLENGFYYDKSSKRLFNSDKQIIKLTNYEEEFFDLLIANLNQFVSLNEIYNHIWGEEVSIFTLRNIVKKIRDKSYYEIIVNKSSVGYKITL
jgi:DNA-binding response OmpR family regulator